MTEKPSAPLAIDLEDQPGHLIRRAHQIAVSKFIDAVGANTTPLQYAILRTLQDRPGIDQVTLAQAIALDNSTTADTAARLEAKGLIVRELLPRRQRRLLLTEAGEALLADLVPAVHRMHEDMLAGLEAGERATLLAVLRKFIMLNRDPAKSA